MTPQRRCEAQRRTQREGISITETRKPIEIISSKEAGIDPGLSTALTFSNGEKINFPKFYRESQKLIGNLQRKCKNSKKVKAKQAKINNQRTNHHHQLSFYIAQRYKMIHWSNDNFNALKRLHGKSYSDVSLGAFRDLLEAKLASRTDGPCSLTKVSCKLSTQTCSSCGATAGPKGLAGLAVREWTCSGCGATHDRDVNAAKVTLFSGQGMSADQGKFISRKL